MYIYFILLFPLFPSFPMIATTAKMLLEAQFLFGIIITIISKVCICV